MTETSRHGSPARPLFPKLVDERPQWQLVDEGWGRKAADFATLSEPANCREYAYVHHRLGIGDGVRLLDVACGAGLALELAGVVGAACSGIDASPRLVAVARHRSPAADVRVGDMRHLPWADASFDAATSFRGIWATTPTALTELRRVLVPGGRLGLTVWGHVKLSPDAWALAPFRLAADGKVRQQADMQLGRPDAGERFLARHGFTDIERHEIPFAWEFADPNHFARALAATGPGYEAIQNVGERAFLQAASREAAAMVRRGLPLRARLPVIALFARTPGGASTQTGGDGAR
ncbi:MAG: methyltransferase domain-containing protein [Hamadaea sp.]|nr:methyltransferase domain-containing protein [Hamadaea sp.]